MHFLPQMAQIYADVLKAHKLSSAFHLRTSATSAAKNFMVEEKVNNSDPQTYAVIGACMAVHRELGSGFLEAVYQEALAIELTKRNIPFVREKPLNVYYSGVQLAARYDADFLCYDSVILELKAVSEFHPKHFAQVIHYLKATRLERGLLVNFGAGQLEYKRVAFTGKRKSFAADVAD